MSEIFRADRARAAAWLDLGVCDYGPAYEIQLQLHARRVCGEIPDVAIVLQHRACITYGRAAHRDNIIANECELADAGVSVYPTDRGGDVTYHGPGQLVLYAIVDLAGYGKDVHAHVHRLEQVLIETVGAFGIEAGRKKEYPGVWTERGKIGAVGLRVNRWVTLHGVSLNVCPDMDHFSLIVPCGIREHGVVSLEGLLDRPIDLDTVKCRMRAAFAEVFGVALADTRFEELAPTY